MSHSPTRRLVVITVDYWASTALVHTGVSTVYMCCRNLSKSIAHAGLLLSAVLRIVILHFAIICFNTCVFENCFSPHDSLMLKGVEESICG